MRPLVERSRELLGEELARELAALPESTTRDGTLYCHASPLSDMDSFYPEPDGQRRGAADGRRGRPGGVRPHPPPVHARGPGGIELVNPGSVGMPLDGDRRAAYAIVAGDGSVELRRVDYDWQAAARAVRERVGELPAKRIEQSRFDVS